MAIRQLVLNVVPTPFIADLISSFRQVLLTSSNRYRGWQANQKHGCVCVVWGGGWAGWGGHPRALMRNGFSVQHGCGCLVAVLSIQCTRTIRNIWNKQHQHWPTMRSHQNHERGDCLSWGSSHMQAIAKANSQCPKIESCSHPASMSSWQPTLSTQLLAIFAKGNSEPWT